MIEPTTPLQSHREAVRHATLECLMEADHLASAMAKAYELFWSPPSEIVLEMLNSNVPFWLDVLQRNTTIGVPLNAQLVAANLPQFPHRAPVVMPDGYSFDGTQFIYLAPANTETTLEDDAPHGN